MTGTLRCVRKAPCKNTMGIEIECGIPSRLSETPFGGWVTEGNYYGFFYAGSDASILFNWSSGLRGVEFVSQPLTPRWLEREILRLEKRVGHWEANQTCGIHVHVNKEWFSKKKANFLYENLKKLSVEEREILFGRDENQYCRYNAQLSWRDRYSAINIKPAATVEFRMFSSGDVQWAIYCVRMVEWMVNNWKGAKPSRMLEASRKFKQQLNILE